MMVSRGDVVAERNTAGQMMIDIITVEAHQEMAVVVV